MFDVTLAAGASVATDPQKSCSTVLWTGAVGGYLWARIWMLADPTIVLGLLCAIQGHRRPGLILPLQLPACTSSGSKKGARAPMICAGSQCAAGPWPSHAAPRPAAGRAKRRRQISRTDRATARAL